MAAATSFLRFPLRPVDPLDAGVACVEERRPRGQVADHEGVAQAGLRERVVPPERALLYGGALGLGAAIFICAPGANSVPKSFW